MPCYWKNGTICWMQIKYNIKCCLYVQELNVQYACYWDIRHHPAVDFPCGGKLCMGVHSLHTELAKFVLQFVQVICLWSWTTHSCVVINGAKFVYLFAKELWLWSVPVRFTIYTVLHKTKILPPPLARAFPIMFLQFSVYNVDRHLGNPHFQPDEMTNGLDTGDRPVLVILFLAAKLA